MTVKLRNHIILLMVVVLLMTLLFTMTLQHAYADGSQFIAIKLTHVYNPGNISRLTESKEHVSFTHTQKVIGSDEKEYVSIHIDEISWVGFAFKYYSDVDAGGGIWSNEWVLYEDPELTRQVSKHPLEKKVLLTPGTYYVVATFKGSYEFYGWYMPCSDIITEAEMIYVGDEESYLRLDIGQKSTIKARYYISEEPGGTDEEYLTNSKYFQLGHSSEFLYPERYEFEYKSKKYEYFTGDIRALNLDPQKVYYAHVYYSNQAEGIPDEWEEWVFYVPIKITDISKNLPKGYTFQDDQKVDYTIITSGKKSNTVKVTGVKDNVFEVKIPATVKKNGVKYKVVEIADKAFKGCLVRDLVIGSNVKKIGDYAFSNSKNLKNLTIGKNVKSIGKNAFYKCEALGSVTIPSKVSKIGKSAFRGCSGVMFLYVKTTKLKASNVGTKAFSGINKYCIVKVPKKKFKTYKSLLKKRGISPSYASFYKL